MTTTLETCGIVNYTIHYGLKSILGEHSCCICDFTKFVTKSEGPKNFPDAQFRCLFLQLAAEKKTPKTVQLEFFLVLLILKRL